MTVRVNATISVDVDVDTFADIDKYLCDEEEYTSRALDIACQRIDDQTRCALNNVQGLRSFGASNFEAA